ncbi:MAG: hypothetical protein HQ581_02565 [Planctomycetes bacterium]|nr:hypothetical protein [Planctomycetota bacterium]
MAPWQREILEAISPCILALARQQTPPRRGVWVEAVKGAGKDCIASAAVLWAMAFSGSPLTIQIAAADQQQASEVHKSASEWMHANPWIGQRVERQRWRLVNKANACEAEILTADALGSHGARPSFLIQNELSHISDTGFVETLADNFSKMPNAFALYCTNAGFLPSLAWDWRQIYQDDPRWAFFKIDQTPPWQNPADIAEAKRRNPKHRFDRLYRGVWQTGSGEGIDPDLIQAAIVHNGPMTYAEDGYGFAGGLDLAISRDHASFAIVAPRFGTARVRVAHVTNWKPPAGGQIDLIAVGNTIRKLRQQFGFPSIYYDPWQCEHLSQTLRQEGLNMIAVQPTAQNLTAMAGAVLEGFRDRKIELFSHPELIDDLQRLSIRETAAGGLRLVMPRGRTGHGDRATAMALVLPQALEAAAQPPPEAYRPERIIGHICAD